MNKFVFNFKSEAETVELAQDLALYLSAKDVLTLAGDLGAGKSTFARALIRALASNAELDVPSPTYTLLQTYDTPRMGVVHADLYRLKSADELYDIGWDEAAEGALLLVEWPERLGDYLPTDYLAMHFEMQPRTSASARTVTLTGYGQWGEKLARFFALRTFIYNAGLIEAKRHYMQGDASSRRYERLVSADKSFIVMDAPPKGEVNSYALKAHLATDLIPFIALAEGLRDAGFSAPEILAADIDQGFLLLEDLGQEGVIANGQPIMQRYGVAVEALAHLHSRPRAASLPTPKGAYTIPAFSEAAMLAEIELLLEWYLPHKGGVVPASERFVFINAWKPLVSKMAALQETWVLRDYHSPNLIWLAERDGYEHIGMIDFQDCVFGPCAYDVVSLTQDARLRISEEQEAQLVNHYLSLRSRLNEDFDGEAFLESYAIMGAQRAIKILGIFARLNKRDGKSAYLKHIPHIQDYLWRNLTHPVLAEVKTWCVEKLPR